MNILLVDRIIPDVSVIGSWNVFLSNLILNETIKFDKIICCGEPEAILDSHILITSKVERYLRKIIFRDSKNIFWNRFKNIFKENQQNERIKVFIFDDLNLLLSIHRNSLKYNLRNKIEIIFNLHGFDFNIDLDKRNKVLEAIDLLVLLSYTSLNQIISVNHSLPCEVKVLSNGVDSNLFFPPESYHKEDIKHKYRIDKDNKIYLWLGQDRKKKGLHIVLKAWRKFHQYNPKSILIILGTHNEIKQDGVFWLPRMLNNELSEIYQMSDFFIFSTLCHEGHPLALTEALKCGCYPLASDIDPISEILDGGKLGYLVSNPNIVDSWINAFNETKSISFNKTQIKQIKEIYNLKDWSSEFNKILNNS